MANSLGGVNLGEIAQMSLPFFMRKLAPLRAISTDFSTEYHQKGDNVTTRVASARTAADFSGGYYGAIADGTLTSKTITLNTFYGDGVKFHDLERAKSAVNLINEFIMPGVDAIGAKIFGDLWNLVNDTNWPAVSHESVIAAADFDRVDLATIATNLTINKCPKMPRFGLMNPTYYGKLVEDSLDASKVGTSDPLVNHEILRAAGFDIYESTECDANGINLAAFFGHPSALLLAAALPEPERELAVGLEIEDFVIPDLGLPVQMRRWYDNNTGNACMTMTVLYGVQVGLQAAGWKVVSA